MLEGFGFLGNEVTTTPGTPMLIVFLAHWCPHCQAEVPVLVKWSQSGLVPESLDVIAVATGTDQGAPNFPPSEWLASERWPELWPVLVDNKDQTAGNAFGLSGYPFMTLVVPTAPCSGATAARSRPKRLQTRSTRPSGCNARARADCAASPRLSR